MWYKYYKFTIACCVENKNKFIAIRNVFNQNLFQITSHRFLFWFDLIDWLQNEMMMINNKKRTFFKSIFNNLQINNDWPNKPNKNNKLNINKEVLSSDFSLISKIASQKALIRKWTPGGVGDIKERENHFKVCSW